MRRIVECGLGVMLLVCGVSTALAGQSQLTSGRLSVGVTASRSLPVQPVAGIESICDDFTAEIGRATTPWQSMSSRALTVQVPESATLPELLTHLLAVAGLLAYFRRRSPAT